MLITRPPMGWNSWNTFGREINDSLIRETADAFCALGLDKAGYKYLVIDDCWSERERDAVTNRIVPDHEKFPSGIKAVADYVHSKGIKFGIYSCAGTRTCANYPGSFDHEFIDAQTFAEWGVDFLKYDFCYKPKTADGPLLYRRMGQALRTCGRDIVFSACNWGHDDVWSWIRSSGAHMYRSTGDICDNFESMKKIVTSQVDKFHDSTPGCFNDIDMLTVGMFGKGNVGASGCTDVEYKTQFAFWCMLGAPLMLGADIRNFAKPEDRYRNILKLITNRDLIEINQDPDVRTAFLPNNGKCPEDGIIVLAKLLADGDIAIGFFNVQDSDVNAFLFFETLGIPDAAGINLKLKDVFTGEDVGEKREFFSMRVAKHDCKLFRATPIRR